MNMQYASLGVRFVAGLIDGVIVWLISVVINFILVSVLSLGQNNTAAGLNLVFNLALSTGYWVFYQSRTGQTVGKKVMNIKVVDSAGNKPTTMTFFLREIIGKFVSGIILLIGYLMILWDAKRQGLHDKIANTYVVRANVTTAAAPPAQNQA